MTEHVNQKLRALECHKRAVRMSLLHSLKKYFLFICPAGFLLGEGQLGFLT